MTEKTAKWVPVIELQISGDDSPAMNALYVQIANALEEAGVFVEHSKQEVWDQIHASGEQHRALDMLDEISPVVRISSVVQK